MSQISMPMRILLIGAAVFLVAWFTVLKPGGAEEELPPVQPANATQPVTTASTAATPAASEPTENTPVADVAVPADVLAKLPKGVSGALKQHKTIVLGVFSDDASEVRPMADDDRYVRNALKKTNRYDGEVYAKNISLSQLSAYGPLVNDLGVNQSPAVVVIDRNLKGTVLTGYVDRIAINQAIADAVDPAITDPFLQKANAVCERFNVRLTRWSNATINGHVAQGEADYRKALIYHDQYLAVTKIGLEAPGKYKSLVAAWQGVLFWKIGSEGLASQMRKLGATKFADEIKASYDETDRDKLERRFDDLGVSDCVVKNRRS
ncbi:hypothetical protein OJ998_27540 [Solirubrobacter taibaiensis]|nr:hypothetical protein [Solirubrobacter taibaiensis]